jgi:hypothetical protein
MRGGGVVPREQFWVKNGHQGAAAARLQVLGIIWWLKYLETREDAGQLL